MHEVHTPGWRRTLVVGLSTEELHGREALNGHRGVLVRRAVHLGNNDRVNVLKAGGELGPDRRERLAVAAPRRVDLEEHVLCRVEHNLLERRADDDAHAVLVLALRLRRALDGLLDGAVEDAAREGDDAVFGQRLAFVPALRAACGDSGASTNQDAAWTA